MYQPPYPSTNSKLDNRTTRSETNTSSIQQMPSPISLPPISAMNFNNQASAGYPASSTSSHALPPPPRSLPPLPYHQPPNQTVPPMPEYVAQQRNLYPSYPSPWQVPGPWAPLPSSNDPNFSVIPSRQLQKNKEVKRRTKTGCMTCRRRRIKCDEGRPECRNCIKSKRACAGYDPVYAPEGSGSGSAPTTPAANEPSSVHVDAITPRRGHETGSRHETTTANDSLRGTDALYHRHAQSQLPHINQPHRMDSGPQSHSIYRSLNKQYVQRRTIEDLCCIAGNRAPHVPPLPPESTPNLESIQKIYDTTFAPGLDRFLETGTSKWFTNHGFGYLVSDREILAQFLLYLTIVSNNATSLHGDNLAVASQEARITWALLNLVVKPAHDGNEEAERLARRVKAVEALLTGEPLTIVRGSMSDFVHQEDEQSESDPGQMPSRPTTTALENSLNRRTEDFWKIVEKFAEAPRPQSHTQQDPTSTLSQARQLLDGLENRDIVFCIMILCTYDGQDPRPVSGFGNGNGHANGNGNGNGHSRPEVAISERLLESASSGCATSTVFEVIAGMASRAFQKE